MNAAEEYANASKMQYCGALDVIEEFEEEISEMGGKCIDIGCGPGNVTMRLILPRLSSDAELIGADISKQMIDYAKKKFHNEKRLSFLEMDIEAKSLPSEELGRYSNALSFYCLHWCSNIRRAFENIYKLLRPEGKALVMLVAWSDIYDVYTRMNEDPRYKPYMEDVDCFVPFFHRCKDSRAVLKKMLNDIGFDVLHCSKREMSFVFQNMEILKNHMMALNPFISRIPDHLQEEYKDVFVREFVSRKILLTNKTDNGQQECSFLERYYILVAYVRKPSDTC